MTTIARGTWETGSRRLLATAGRVILEPAWYLMHASGFCSTVLMLRSLEPLRWHIGRIGAWLRHVSALDRVPAYRTFIRSHAMRVGTERPR